jgi:hypothetical protein
MSRVYAGMVDFQYTPDMNDPVAKLKIAMTNMDGESKCMDSKEY